MTQFRHLLLWLLLLAGMPLAAAASAVISTPPVRAQLVAHAPDELGAGKTAWLGLVIRHQPDWHTYWKNSGDSSLPKGASPTAVLLDDAGAIGKAYGARATPHMFVIDPQGDIKTATNYVGQALNESMAGPRPMAAAFTPAGGMP